MEYIDDSAEDGLSDDSFVGEDAGAYSAGLPHADISREIIGASMEVLNLLKPGLDERVYEQALIHELHLRGLNAENQRSFPVLFKGHTVGKLIPDLIVENKVVVDTKVVTAFNEAHLAQMLGYLTITSLQVGLLINFHHATLKWKRVQK